MNQPRGTVIGPVRPRRHLRNSVVLRLESRWLCLFAGVALAQVFLLRGCSWAAWFLSSLVHELGHSVAGIVCGYPAVPAVRLDGHAATVIHDERSAVLTVLAIAGLAFGAWFHRERRWIAALFGAATLLAPVLGFSALRNPFFLTAGHLSELTFAGILIHRALSGSSESRSEITRMLLATGGWYLLAKNAALFVGLMTDTQTIIDYYSNGSFGLQNDLIRLAEDEWDVPLARVAGLMLVPTFLAPTLAVVLAHVTRARED